MVLEGGEGMGGLGRYGLGLGVWGHGIWGFGVFVEGGDFVYCVRISFFLGGALRL